MFTMVHCYKFTNGVNYLAIIDKFTNIYQFEDLQMTGLEKKQKKVDLPSINGLI